MSGEQDQVKRILTPRVKLRKVKKRTAEPQNIECRRVGSLRSVIFYKIDRIPYFDIRYSLFDILFFIVSFTIRPAAFQASGGARMKLHEIKCHFREVPHAVTEYRFRRRPRTRPL